MIRFLIAATFIASNAVLAEYPTKVDFIVQEQWEVGGSKPTKLVTKDFKFPGGKITISWGESDSENRVHARLVTAGGPDFKLIKHLESTGGQQKTETFDVPAGDYFWNLVSQDSLVFQVGHHEVVDDHEKAIVSCDDDYDDAKSIGRVRFAIPADSDVAYRKKALAHVLAEAMVAKRKVIVRGEAKEFRFDRVEVMMFDDAEPVSGWLKGRSRIEAKHESHLLHHAQYERNRGDWTVKYVHVDGGLISGG